MNCKGTPGERYRHLLRAVSDCPFLSVLICRYKAVCKKVIPLSGRKYLLLMWRGPEAFLGLFAGQLGNRFYRLGYEVIRGQLMFPDDEVPKRPVSSRTRSDPK